MNSIIDILSENHLYKIYSNNPFTLFIDDKIYNYSDSKISTHCLKLNHKITDSNNTILVKSFQDYYLKQSWFNGYIYFKLINISEFSNNMKLNKLLNLSKDSYSYISSISSIGSTITSNKLYNIADSSSSKFRINTIGNYYTKLSITIKGININNCHAINDYGTCPKSENNMERSMYIYKPNNVVGKIPFILFYSFQKSGYDQSCPIKTENKYYCDWGDSDWCNDTNLDKPYNVCDKEGQYTLRKFLKLLLLNGIAVIQLSMVGNDSWSAGDLYKLDDTCHYKRFADNKSGWICEDNINYGDDGFNCGILSQKSKALWNSDIRYIISSWNYIKNNQSDLDIDNFGIMGFSVGGQMVSNSFQNYDILFDNILPKLGIIIAGGTYQCYQCTGNTCPKNTTEARWDCSYSNLYKSSTGQFNCDLSKNKNETKHHPPVLLMQSINDDMADPNASINYFDTLYKQNAQNSFLIQGADNTHGINTLVQSNLGALWVYAIIKKLI